MNTKCYNKGYSEGNKYNIYWENTCGVGSKWSNKPQWMQQTHLFLFCTFAKRQKENSKEKVKKKMQGKWGSGEAQSLAGGTCQDTFCQPSMGTSCRSASTGWLRHEQWKKKKKNLPKISICLLVFSVTLVFCLFALFPSFTFTHTLSRSIQLFHSHSEAWLDSWVAVVFEWCAADGKCWVMTDGCDKQMVLLVISLITQIQSAMKSELCLVKATQSEDKFILHAIDFDREKALSFVEKRD